MYKIVLKITKETRVKCGIKTVKYHNKEKNIIELWHKMSDVKTQIKHTNIDNVALKRIRKYCGKRIKDITKEEKEQYKVFFEGEKGIFIIEKLTCDIIERCFKKKLGYNYDNIMV